jgi:hypothetical protein
MKQILKKQSEYTPQTVPFLYSSPKNPEPKDLEKVVLTLDIVRDRIDKSINRQNTCKGWYVLEAVNPLIKESFRSKYKLMVINRFGGDREEVISGSLKVIDTFCRRYFLSYKRFLLGYRLKDEELIG